MKITVKIEDIEVIIDRPKMDDYNSSQISDGPEWRKSLLEGTIFPSLKEAVNQTKELYKLKYENKNII